MKIALPVFGCRANGGLAQSLFLAFGLLLAPGAWGAQPLRVVSTLNSVFDNQEGRPDKTRCFTRWPVVIGSADAGELVLSANGWYINGGYTAVGNSFTIASMALEKDGTSLHVPVTWSGGRSLAVNPGDNDLHSDPIPASAFGQAAFARGERYYVRTLLSVAAAGQAIPLSSARAASVNSEWQAAWFDPALTVLVNGVDSTGKFATSGTAPESRGSGFYPIVLGRFVSGDPVTMIALGDSITAGFGDSKSPANGFGMFQRALVDPDGTGHPVAGINWARGGIASAAYANATVLSWAKYANHAYVNLGTNDIGTAGGGNTATLKANLQTIWNNIKAQGVQRIIHGTLEPRTTSTDSFATVAGQTPISAGWAAGGKSEDMNAWLQSQLGTQLFAVLPFASNRAPGDPFRWAANGTPKYTCTDGVHPSAQGHIFGGNEIRAAIAQLSPAALSVSLTAPAGNGTVSGTAVLVSAAATGTNGQAVAGVQFKLDGANLLAEDTTSPYAVNWNSTAVGDGIHTLSAVARDAMGNTATAANVAVTVTNGLSVPEIEVTGNGTVIQDGDTTPDASDLTDFGSVDAASGSVTCTYVIRNTGTASLAVANVALSGAHAADFSVVAQPVASVAVGGSTTFGVKFDPNAAGLRTAVVSFGNSDADENPCQFSIQGTGVAGSGLPPPWTKQDIGAVGQAGDSTYAGGTFTVAGSGVDFSPRTADAFQYACQPVSGTSWTLTARVAALSTAPDAIKGEGGVMIREALTAGSAYAQMGVTTGRGLRFQYRTAAGSSSADVSGGSGVAPYWVRVVRNGSTFTGYKSVDGVAWTSTGSATFSMGTTAYAGLAVCHHGGLGTATFDNVTLTP